MLSLFLLKDISRSVIISALNFLSCPAVEDTQRWIRFVKEAWKIFWM